MNPSISNQYFLRLALSAAAIMLLSTAWVSDDAFITLRVIDNFINGWGLRYNVIERVQVYTHPLWLFFLAPFYAITREALLTTMLVSVSLSLGAFWLLACRISANIQYGCVLVLAAMASGTITQFATSGLETPLTYVLLALLVWLSYRTEKLWIPAAMAGLLLLNRMDLALLVGPLIVYRVFKTPRGGRWKIAAAALLPVTLWIIFSLIYYGAPFPNTAYAKLGTGLSTAMQALQGLRYTRNFLFNDPLLALLIGHAVFQALRSRDRIMAALGTGILLYVGYTVVIGGDFMSGRFFAAPGFLAICLLARLPAPPGLIARKKMAGGILLAVLFFLLFARATQAPATVNNMDYGIADERGFYYLHNGLPAVLNGWRATGVKPVHPWGHRGLVLRSLAEQSGKPLMVITGTIGMRGYYGGPMVHIIDELALADAFLARLPALPNSRVGHYLRTIPPGYSETVLLPDPVTATALQPLLNDVLLATRARILTEGRASAVWRLLSGYHGWVYSAVL
jgi:arabinofuranosyltransferase